MTDTPLFTNAQGEQQTSLYHSVLTRHRDLMVKFKQHPFPSQFPRDGTSGKMVYMELPDGLDYSYQIENEDIVTVLSNINTDEWYRITASGRGTEAVLTIQPGDSYELQERLATTEEEPTVPVTAQRNTIPTHNDCTTMTLETVAAFEKAGTVLESDAIARIYNTHFIALSKQKGGLIR